jgi:glutamate/tyrosine decarboxylase-like PLP-dependent enzyme
MVRESGGNIMQEFDVLDVYRRYKELRPDGIAELNENGVKLAQALAEEAAVTIDKLKVDTKVGQNA